MVGGGLDEADRHFAAAVALEDWMGARPLVARSKLWWATLRSQPGAPRAQSAVSLLREAHGSATVLGMARVADQALRLMA